jgi:hypothetical protein
MQLTPLANACLAFCSHGGFVVTSATPDRQIIRHFMLLRLQHPSRALHGVVEIVDTGSKGVPLLLLHPAGIHFWQKQIPAFVKALS